MISSAVNAAQKLVTDIRAPQHSAKNELPTRPANNNLATASKALCTRACSKL